MVTLAAVVVAWLIGWWLWVYYEEAPWTRDARVSADIVGVTPDVSGLVSEVKVTDNQTVHRGDLLLVVDPARFRSCSAAGRGGGCQPAGHFAAGGPRR